jgi:hypothetical protein
VGQHPHRPTGAPRRRPSRSRTNSAEPAWSLTVELDHRRPFVDGHAPLAQDASQPSSQERRLDRGGAAHEDATAKDR